MGHVPSVLAFPFWRTNFEEAKALNQQLLTSGVDETKLCKDKGETL
jgi:hypothetical protein